MGRLALFGPGARGGPGWIACYSDDQLTAVVARFAYDAQNRRIARWSAATSQWTYFVHGPGGELLSELVKTGDPAQPWAPVRDYVWLDGRPVAQIEYQGASARTYYVHADHLGTPRMLTISDKAVVWSATVQPYGEVTETTTPDSATGRTVVTNLRLPGQYDERLFAAAGISGLQGPYYNWNRWYLPSVGRYLELDPLAQRGKFNSPYTPDWYNYALGNPLRYIDSTGLYSEVCWRNVKGPLGSLGAKHCYLRVNGKSGETVSYWAETPIDSTPHVTPDLRPDAPAECHPIDPPGGGGTCTDNRTEFDLCMEMQMVQCASCQYNIRSFNCCDCVATAIQKCGGTYNGPWPDNIGWSPNARPPAPKPL